MPPDQDESKPSPTLWVANEVAVNHGTLFQIGTNIGDITVHPPKATPIPQQLPAAGQFIGRDAELTRLTAALDRGAVTGSTLTISAVAGAGGIGKTKLALHWAHQHLHRFTDGQLFVDLRGFAPGEEPMPPDAAVRGFLEAMGVDPQQIPTDLDAQVGLYRSLLVGKRMLILLDNARDARQVTPLLPGNSTCTVVITSRDRLAGLNIAHHAQRIVLDALDDHDARELLAARIGHTRLDTELAAVNELLASCAGYPLALSIVGARAAAHPSFALAVWADELRVAETRLGVLDDGDPAASLPAVFSWSYAALSPDIAAVLGLIALAPGPDISVSAVSCLTGSPLPSARSALRNLEQASLAQEHAPGRWQMHDLIRLHAMQRAGEDQSHEHVTSALIRMAGHYVHSAYAGDRLLFPHRMPTDIDATEDVCGTHRLLSASTAFQWFDAEHANLLAVLKMGEARGWDALVYQLAWSMHGYHYQSGHIREYVATWRTALDAAQRIGDSAMVTRTERRLGQAYARAGMHSEALDHLHRALTAAEQIGDVTTQAHTQHALAQACEARGDEEQAAAHAIESLRLHRMIDNPEWEALALNSAGWRIAKIGKYDAAVEYCRAALKLYRRHSNERGEATTLMSLGYIAHRTGSQNEAVAHLRTAIAMFRAFGNNYEAADALALLGEALALLKEHAEAEAAWRDAVVAYRRQHRVAEAEAVEGRLRQLRSA